VTGPTGTTGPTGDSGNLAAAAVSQTNVTISGLAEVADTVPLTSAGMVVLLAGQTAPIENGPWVVAAGAWSRPSVFATGSSANGVQVWVTGGARGVDTLWVCDSPVGSDVVDTNSLSFRSRGPESNIRFFRWGDEDFFNAFISANGWTTTTVGGGGATGRMINDADGVGVAELLAGTSSTGQAALTRYAFTLALIAGGIVALDPAGYFWMSIRFKVPVHSDGTNTFEERWGLGDVQSGDPNNAMYFMQDNNSSTKIQFVMVSGGVKTTTPTTVDLAEDTFYHGEARFSPADPGEVYVYVDGVFQFKTSSNFPTEPIGPYIATRKTAGSLSPSNRFDWHKGAYRFPSQRVLLA